MQMGAKLKSASMNPTSILAAQVRLGCPAWYDLAIVVTYRRNIDTVKKTCFTDYPPDFEFPVV